MTNERSDLHSFDVALACEVGVEKAILIGNFKFWISENEKRKSVSHFQKGEYWTYDSAKSLVEKYPYFNEKTVARWLVELEKTDWIKTDNFNKDALNKTKWFARGKRLNDWLSRSISQNEESTSQNENCISQSEISIPQNETSFSQNEITISQNEESLYKDTVINPIANPLVNAIRDVAANDCFGEFEEKKGQALTPSSARPPSPKPIPIPVGKVYGDGVLQADVVTYYTQFPDQFPLHIYLPFLRYWTSKNQKGDPVLIGVEKWRTQNQWDIEIRLNSWNERDIKKALENQPQHGNQPAINPNGYTGSAHANRYGSADYETAFNLVDALAKAGGLNG